MFTIAESLTAVKAYLSSGKTLNDFQADHGIGVKREGNLIIVDYDQIEVKWTEPYGYAARGLVLDANTFEIVAFGLGKFFNAGEHYAAQIDWDKAHIFEKIDGSMVCRWWNPHESKFSFSTRYQLPGGLLANTVNSGVMTWQSMIDKCMSGLDLDQPKDESWVFEVCSPLNMVVVRHDSFYCKLLAIRNIKTLEEVSVEDHRLCGLAPKSYRFSSTQEVLDFANSFPATTLEGFVVFDSVGRIKVKSDQYVHLHRLKDGLSSVKNLILVARGNDYEEITTHFPQFRDDLDAVAKLINETIAEHDGAYLIAKDIVSQKDFAITINGKGLRCTAALFNVRGGKTPTIREAFLKMPDTAFVKLFKEDTKKLLGEKYADDTT